MQERFDSLLQEHAGNKMTVMLLNSRPKPRTCNPESGWRG